MLARPSGAWGCAGCPVRFGDAQAGEEVGLGDFCCWRVGWVPGRAGYRIQALWVQRGGMGVACRQRGSPQTPPAPRKVPSSSPATHPPPPLAGWALQSPQPPLGTSHWSSRVASGPHRATHNPIQVHATTDGDTQPHAGIHSPARARTTLYGLAKGCKTQIPDGS